jgi:hypothetical protein
MLYKLIQKNGGYWIWISWSKSTDIAPTSSRRSFLYGAVYITNIIPTNIYNKKCHKQRLLSQYQHSNHFPYQAIVPCHEYARFELPQPIPVHDVKKGENRVSLWKPDKDSDIAKILTNISF